MWSVKVLSHACVEGNDEADPLADLGCLSSRLNPVFGTPNLLASPHTPSLAPSKQARLMPTDVLRCINFSSPLCVRFTSLTANDILRSLDVNIISDTEKS